jgi:cell division protein FtsQ
MGAFQLRHPSPATGRKPVPRGASRPVAREPLRARLPKLAPQTLKRLGWILVLVALVWSGQELAPRLLPYIDRPIAKVGISGELNYTSAQAVEQRIELFVDSSFFNLDLTGMRAALESMPWIASAEVRRIWPDQVQIQLHEYLPIARWGEEALLNNQGEAFVPRELSSYHYLPQLHGPERAKQRIMQHYQVLSQMLRPLGFSIRRLELRERGSWFVSLGSGEAGPSIELLLGRDHIVEKVHRLVAIYDKALKPQIANIERIDLRYANGLAVAWREPVSDTAASGRAVN